MNDVTKYKVLRPHHGDQEYNKGDTREALPADVAHLVELGVLEPHGKVKPAAEGEKKAPDHANKKAPEPSNKGK